MIGTESLLNKYIFSIVGKPEEFKNRIARELIRKYNVEIESILNAYLKSEINKECEIKSEQKKFTLSEEDWIRVAILHYELSDRKELEIKVNQGEIITDVPISCYGEECYALIVRNGNPAKYELYAETILDRLDKSKEKQEKHPINLSTPKRYGIGFTG